MGTLSACALIAHTYAATGKETARGYARKESREKQVF
jgi:hypothetical protein